MIRTVRSFEESRSGWTRRQVIQRLSAGVVALAAWGAPGVSRAAADLKLKKRVAVTPFDWTGHDVILNWTIPAEFRNAIYDKLVKKLFDTGKFVVLEREALQALDVEKGIKQENTGQNQRGKTIPAQALVKGKVTDFALLHKGKNLDLDLFRRFFGGILNGFGRTQITSKVALNVSIFDVDTSALLGTEEGAGEVKSSKWRVNANAGGLFVNYEQFENSPLGEATTKAINMAVDKIVKKLDEAPWSARVADWDEAAKEITLNAGVELGVREGYVFDVHRVTKVIKDPETGEVLGVRTSKVGVIKVKSVEKRIAVAEVMEGETFQVGDIVRTQN